MAAPGFARSVISDFRNSTARELSKRAAVLLAAFVCLAAIAVVIHGYHPYSEDAAIYVPAIKKQLDPTLYPHHNEFFLSHARLSLFSIWVAQSVRLTHVSLETGLLSWHIATLAFFLAAAWWFCTVCFHDSRMAVYGTLLLTSVLTLPVAGTSVLLTDPYLTARSLSTPALLLMLCFVLEDRFWSAFICFLVALLVHPLMAAYGAFFALAYCAVKRKQWGLIITAGICIALALLLARHVPLLTRTSPEYRAAAQSRSYFFLSSWKWHEKLGLVAPLVIFAWLGWKTRRPSSDVVISLARTVVITGSIGVATALALSYDDSLFAFARYQPLRIFHIAYILLFLIAVNLWIQRLPRYRSAMVAAVVTIAGASMFMAARLSFPDSAHLELRFTTEKSRWIQAFAWVRGNTPKDAVFALDPEYMDLPEEDHFGFRAYAERVSLADRTKDGGVAALFPQLADEWFEDARASANVRNLTAPGAVTSLEKRGASWVITSDHVDSALTCPYRNGGLSVCELPPTPTRGDFKGTESSIGLRSRSTYAAHRRAFTEPVL